MVQDIIQSRKTGQGNIFLPLPKVIYLNLVNESDNAMIALEGLLPDHYWVGRIRIASRDTTQNGEKITRLLVERCYLLLNEDFSALEELENQIKLFSED